MSRLSIVGVRRGRWWKRIRCECWGRDVGQYFPGCSWVVVSGRVVSISTGSSFRSKPMVWVPCLWIDPRLVHTPSESMRPFGLGLRTTMGDEQRSIAQQSTAQYSTVHIGLHFKLSSIIQHRQRVHFPAMQVRQWFSTGTSKQLQPSASTLNSVACSHGPRPEHFLSASSFFMRRITWCNIKQIIFL